MKYIKCSRCGCLVRPINYADHLRNCAANEDSLAATEEKEVMDSGQPKRQKLDLGNTESNQAACEEDGTVCVKCSKHFSRKWDCQRHERKCNGSNLRKSSITTCKQCGKQFSNYRARLKHEKACDLNKIGNFTCATCGDKFTCVRDYVLKVFILNARNNSGYI